MRKLLRAFDPTGNICVDKEASEAHAHFLSRHPLFWRDETSVLAFFSNITDLKIKLTASLMYSVWVIYSHAGI